MPNKTEIVMETTHGRKDKCKTEFKAVINKVLVSGIILATLMTSTITPAYAASNYQVSVGNDALITQQYGVSVQSEIQNIRNTIQAINVMRANGVVTDSMIQKLASQIYNLDRAMDIAGEGATVEIMSVITEAENAISGLDNASPAEIALVMLKAKFVVGEDSHVATNKEAHVAITSFSDIGPSHWAYNDVMIIANKGIIAGTSAPVNGVGTYNPSGKVTVGEFLTLSTRLVAADKIQDEGEFAHWAVPYYMAAIDAGLITPQQFACTPEVLNAPMSREDMAMVLVNIAKSNGETLKTTPGIQQNISDYEKVDVFKRDAVKQAYSNGLIAGKDSSGRFDPQGTLTRAEVATVFCRVMNYTKRPTVVVKPGGSSGSGTVTSDQYDDVKVLTGENAGLMRLDVAKKYDLQALQSVRFYKENGKLYVSIDLPQLPDGFKWVYSVDAYTKDGNYVFYTMNADCTGKTGKQVIEVYSKYDDETIADIDYAAVSVMVINNENKSIVSHKLSTKAPNQVLRQSSLDSSDASWEAFDTSNIFGW